MKSVGASARSIRSLATILSVALALGALGLGCTTSRKCGAGDDASGIACQTARAREQLAFGLSRSDAMETMGAADVAPPWRTNVGAVPTRIANPYDSSTIESKLGEQYEVVRFFVEVEQISDCPFLQGWIRFEPLVFFEDHLVGWNWEYVADLTGRPTNDAQMSRFGVFCNSARVEQVPAP